MDVSSELKNASLEAWTSAEEAAIAAKGIARIGFNITTGRIVVYDGAEFKPVPLFADIQAHKVGDIKQSVLDLADFIASYDNTWLEMNGYGLYTADGEPYLAADYPELASFRPEWVETVDVGYGSKEYLFVPDSRSGSLITYDDSSRVTVRAGIVSDIINDMARKPMPLGGFVYASAEVGLTCRAKASNHKHYAQESTSTQAIEPLTAGGGGYTGFAFKSNTFAAGEALYVPANAVTPDYTDRKTGWADSSSYDSDIGSDDKMTTQGTIVRTYLKAKVS